MEIDIEKLWAEGQSLLAGLGVNLIGAIAIFVIGRWIAQAITGALKKFMASRDVEDTLETFVGNLVYMGLLTVVILASLNQLGIQTASLIAVLGAAGLAIGLALQGSLSNFASGVLIILFKPYRVGDWIEAAGVSGKIHGLQIFTTTLLTGDNKLIIVPNSQIMNGVITNYSTQDTRRIDLVVGVSYADDLDKVRSVLTDILSAEKRILTDPEPLIAVNDLGASSVDFVVRPWVRTVDYWNVRFELTETIKKRFDRESISFPFPQHDVHLYQAASE